MNVKLDKKNLYGDVSHLEQIVTQNAILPEVPKVHIVCGQWLVLRCGRSVMIC